MLLDPERDANIVADALIAYLDTGAAPGAITLSSTFVAGGAKWFDGLTVFDRIDRIGKIL